MLISVEEQSAQHRFLLFPPTYVQGTKLCLSRKRYQEQNTATTHKTRQATLTFAQRNSRERMDSIASAAVLLLTVLNKRVNVYHSHR